MADLKAAIPILRESVVAVLRIGMTRHENEGLQQPAQFEGSLVGTAFCVVADRYVVTAFHVLNAGQPRNLADKFYAFAVPGNAESAFHFPVVAFPVERPDLDIAILEIGSCATAGVHLPAIPVSFTPQIDGTRVITLGYPAPAITQILVDPQGEYCGGEFFLKSHANAGIVSASYTLGGVLIYEFNVGWHHGESGGPIAALDDTAAVFSLIQQYRNVQSPHGTMAGPRRGNALAAIQHELTNLGVVGT